MHHITCKLALARARPPVQASLSQHTPKPLLSRGIRLDLFAGINPAHHAGLGIHARNRDSRSLPADPVLATDIDAWPRLPRALRDAVLALVKLRLDGGRPVRLNSGDVGRPDRSRGSALGHRR